MDVAAADSFIDHGERIVCIGDLAFALFVGGEFFAGKDVFSRSFSVSDEFSSRADICPSDIVTFSQSIERILHADCSWKIRF